MEYFREKIHNMHLYYRSSLRTQWRTQWRIQWNSFKCTAASILKMVPNIDLDRIGNFINIPGQYLHRKIPFVRAETFRNTMITIAVCMPYSIWNVRDAPWPIFAVCQISTIVCGMIIAPAFEIYYYRKYIKHGRKIFPDIIISVNIPTIAWLKHIIINCYRTAKPFVKAGLMISLVHAFAHIHKHTRTQHTSEHTFGDIFMILGGAILIILKRAAIDGGAGILIDYLCWKVAGWYVRYQNRNRPTPPIRPEQPLRPALTA